jgi:hypothetical protein
MSKAQNQKPEAEVVTVETPKTETTVTSEKPKNTPVMERQYQIVAAPSITPKGKQRQIVIAALQVDPQRGFTVKEVAEFATKAGLSAVGGIEPSCRYHLHHLTKLGIAKILNPTTSLEEQAA